MYFLFLISRRFNFCAYWLYSNLIVYADILFEEDLRESELAPLCITMYSFPMALPIESVSKSLATDVAHEAPENEPQLA